MYNVPVQLVAPDVAVQSLSPASVTLTIERIEERSFPIALHYVGGHPADIVVTYRRSARHRRSCARRRRVLAQVAAARRRLMMPTAPKSMDAMVRPVAVDASGAELAGVAVAPELVRVQMHVVAGTARGDAPVRNRRRSRRGEPRAHAGTGDANRAGGGKHLAR